LLTLQPIRLLAVTLACDLIHLLEDNFCENDVASFTSHLGLLKCKLVLRDLIANIFQLVRDFRGQTRDQREKLFWKEQLVQRWVTLHLHMGRIFTASPSNSIISYMILNGENPLKWFSVVALAEFGLGVTLRRRLHALNLSSFNINASNLL
jgi:hypothetical protein